MDNLRIEIYDPAELAESFVSSNDALSIFRTQIKRARDRSKELFWNDTSVTKLVHAQARFVDFILTRAWQQFFLQESGIALVAVGGYGRGELHPSSDIDILILLSDEAPQKYVNEIERYLTFLWDIGLEVGHSVRTVSECVDEASKDITIATNVFESRFVIGSESLYIELSKHTGPDEIWPSRRFFESKWQEQKRRHQKYHDTAYNLEPNIKEGPGCLRDIQTIGWVTKRHFAATSLYDLVTNEFLTEIEYRSLIDAQEFLWKIRFALHLLAGRREDRLLFEHQRTLAQKFGYRDENPANTVLEKGLSRAADGHRLGVELFMKQYFRTVMELSRLNEMLLQHYQEAILFSDESGEPVAINRRFQARKGFIEITSPDVFKRYPFALLEVFLVMQQNPTLKGVRASTIRSIRQHRYLIDDKFRADLRCRSIFIEILKQASGVTHELRRMNSYGLLAHYIPAFGRIVGQMQFDLFHVYTVDQHTLFVVRNLRRISVEQFAHELPLCSRIVKQIPKPELLYLAGIFHDIAKGRGGDHSMLGADEAREFCRLHGLSDYDCELVAWLVKNHLTMSVTAQHKDISDPEIINQFASKVGDRVRLDYLYLLTVADMRATNPSLWNSWKESLLIEFYNQTQRALRRGLENPMDKPALIRETRHVAARLLETQGVNADFVRDLWDQMQDEYFLRYTPEQIAWHALGIKNIRQDCCLVLNQTTAERGSTDIFIRAQQKIPLFAIVTSTLNRLNLNIVEARIAPSKDGYSMDTYTVLEYDGQPVADASRQQEIDDALYKNLEEGKMPQLLNRKDGGRRIEQFSISTQVNFSDDETNAQTVMEVISTDRPGLLSRIAHVLTKFNILVRNAKISTFGAQAEDIFFVTNQFGEPITDQSQRESIRKAICELLDARPRAAAN